MAHIDLTQNTGSPETANGVSLPCELKVQLGAPLQGLVASTLWIARRRGFSLSIGGIPQGSAQNLRLGNIPRLRQSCQALTIHRCQSQCHNSAFPPTSGQISSRHGPFLQGNIVMHYNGFVNGVDVRREIVMRYNGAITGTIFGPFAESVMASAKPHIHGARQPLQRLLRGPLPIWAEAA